MTAPDTTTAPAEASAIASHEREANLVVSQNRSIVRAKMAPEAITPYRFLTLDQSFDTNAARHEANAARYIAEGRPSWAEGSLRKAKRNRARAAILRAMLAPPSDPWLAATVKQIEDERVNHLLHGNPNDRTDSRIGLASIQDRQ